METIKDYIINILKKDGHLEDAINVVLQMSEERLQWFKDVAWNLARVTGKYDRLATIKELSILEKLILIKIETEETKKWNEELNLLSEFEHQEYMKKIEEQERKSEDFRQKFEKFKRIIRQYNIDKASSSMIYLFPIGEA